MSRCYEMLVEITDLDPLREQAVKEAAQQQWPFEDWFPSNGYLASSAEGSLCGGELEEDFAKRLAHAIWKAHGKFCPVEVRATYLEEIPHDDYCLDEDDYEEFLAESTTSFETEADRDQG